MKCDRNHRPVTGCNLIESDSGTLDPRVLTPCLALAHSECKRFAAIGPTPIRLMGMPKKLRTAHLARAVLNAGNLSTPLGLLIAAAGRAQLRGAGEGLILAEQFRWPAANAGAFTVGNVVVIPQGTLNDLSRRHPRVLAHESVHAWQYSACLGLPFLAFYAVAAGWSWLRTADRASANAFERWAGLEAGGYREYPKDNAGLRRIAGKLGVSRSD